MNSKERILKTLKHEEPDRVPLFEICISNKLGEYILGKKVNLWGLGSSTKAAIEIQLKGDLKEYKKFIEDSFLDSLELHNELGLDMMVCTPQAFVHSLNFGLYIVGVGDIYDVEIKKEGEHSYKLISKDTDAPGFWNTCAFVPESGTFQMISDNIKEGGEKEFERYIEYLENKDLTKIPERLKYSLDAMKKAKDINDTKYNLSFLGQADLQFPCFVPYLSLFLELMITNGDLVHRYMRATTNSMKAMFKLQLELGVDGLLGGNDWCYGGGPMMSPAHFDEYMAPYLKELVDLTHSYNKFFIKHLDGNTYKILESLVNTCGIDAYHSIEPPAGMDIEKVKNMYGDKITLIGNIDCADILCNWSPDMIKKEVKRIIKAVSPGGGHIFSTSNVIHDGIPIENSLAFISAVKEFGTYPISV